MLSHVAQKVEEAVTETIPLTLNGASGWGGEGGEEGGGSGRRDSAYSVNLKTSKKHIA